MLGALLGGLASALYLRLCPPQVARPIQCVGPTNGPNSVKAGCPMSYELATMADFSVAMYKPSVLILNSKCVAAEFASCVTLCVDVDCCPM